MADNEMSATEARWRDRLNGDNDSDESSSDDGGSSGDSDDNGDDWTRPSNRNQGESVTPDDDLTRTEKRWRDRQTDTTSDTDETGARGSDRSNIEEGQSPPSNRNQGESVTPDDTESMKDPMAGDPFAPSDERDSGDGGSDTPTTDDVFDGVIDRKQEEYNVAEYAPEQGVEETADDSNIQEQAGEFESEFLAGNEQFSAEDVAVTRDGDTLSLEYTSTGQEVSTARELGLSTEDIFVTESGSVVPTSAAGEAELDIRGIEQSINEQFPDASGYSISETKDDVYTVSVDTPGDTERFVAGDAADDYLNDLEAGQEKATAQRLGVGVGDIDIEDGLVVPTSEAGRQAIAAEQPSPMRDPMGGDPFESAQGELPTASEQTDPRTQIERELEAQTGVELDEADIDFTEMDDSIVGELSTLGEQTVAAESTPFQNTAISPLLEAGARLDVRGTQFREKNIAKAQEVTGMGNLFAGERKFLGDTYDAFAGKISELAEFGPADLLGAEKQGVDVTGGTLPVFSGVGGAGGVGSARAAAAGVAVGASLSASGATVEGDTPTAQAEVELPEDGDQFTQNEVTQPTRPGFFKSEVPIPDPAAQETGPLGVPEQGITIDVTDDPGIGQATEIEPTDPVTTTDIETPTEEPTEPFVRTSPQQVQKGEQSGGGVTQRERGRVEQSQERSVVPEEFLPDDNQRIGFGRGWKYERERGFGQVREVGRTFDESDYLTLPEERFLAVGEETPSSLDLIDFAQQAQATTGQRPDSGAISGVRAEQLTDTGIGTNVGSPADTNLGVDITQTLDQIEASLPATAQPTAPQPGEFGTPNVEVPGYENLERFATPTPTEITVPDGKRRVRPRLNRDVDDNDRKRKSGDIGSDLFDNPALAPGEIKQFEEDLLGDL